MSDNRTSHLNVSFSDLLLAYPLYAKNLIAKIMKIHDAYQNYRSILRDIRFKRYPVEAVLRNNGRKVMLNNAELTFVASCNRYKGKIEYDLENDIVIIPYGINLQGNGQKYYHDVKKEDVVKLYGAINNGDIISVFLHEDYRRLPFIGKTVLDIGANIGDSPIYFAINRAEKVIALEPFSKNYQLAKKNIQSNNLSDKIILLQAGCASGGGTMTIDPNYISGTISRLASSTYGTSIELMTLKDIVDKYSIKQGSVLKMDCEGCEYDAILSASADTLRTFGYIRIEYHYGYRNLKEKLRESGFKVSTSIPKTDPKDVFTHRGYQKAFVGMIDATMK